MRSWEGPHADILYVEKRETESLPFRRSRRNAHSFHSVRVELGLQETNRRMTDERNNVSSHQVPPVVVVVEYSARSHTL